MVLVLCFFETCDFRNFLRIFFQKKKVLSCKLSKNERARVQKLGIVFTYYGVI